MNIIKFVKKKNGWYDIVLENERKILVYEDLILKYNLLISKQIDENDLDNLIYENNYYIGYNNAIKLISRKMRSVFEIKEYLKKSDISSEMIDSIITKITNQGYLNDKEYAVAYVNDRLNLSNDGPNKIISYLRQNSIPDEYIFSALETFEISVQKERIYKLIQKQIKLNNNKGKYLLEQKIVINLVNLGYDRSLVLDTLKSFDFNDKDILEKEYKKIYDKLSKKYSGKELEYRIKQKMYQKGFTN